MAEWTGLEELNNYLSNLKPLVKIINAIVAIPPVSQILAGLNNVYETKKADIKAVALDLADKIENGEAVENLAADIQYFLKKPEDTKDAIVEWLRGIAGNIDA